MPDLRNKLKNVEYLALDYPKKVVVKMKDKGWRSSRVLISKSVKGETTELTVRGSRNQKETINAWPTQSKIGFQAVRAQAKTYS